MSDVYRVLINLGRGNWETGFPSVVMQLRSPGQVAPIQVTGRLPAANSLGLLHGRWQQYYVLLQSNFGLRRPALRGIEVEADDITNVSIDEFEQLSRLLQRQLNLWLSVETFAGIERKLRTVLGVDDNVQLIVEVDQSSLRSFPWHLWDFFDDYPQAEIGLSSRDFVAVKALRKRKKRVRILAVFGSAENIDVQQDRRQLEQIPDAEVLLLTEPSRAMLSQQLWDEKGWDILFFAGHSSAAQGGEHGYVYINASEKITITQLKKSLNNAIAHGLQLAIFNSCEGLGIARDLADVQFPQTIVMREPIPDQVAQAFLLNFLKTFSRGVPLYLAVRKARERLEVMEGTFPGASWLPVICQNPAISEVLTWQSLRDPVVAGASAVGLQWRRVGRVAIACFVSVGMVVGVRQLGWIQTLELKAFDHLMRLRPKESVDERLLVVTITETDVQAQADMRHTSLSDERLSLLLERLNRYKPKAIGLDIYRDWRTDESVYPALAQAFQSDDSFLTVCRFSDGTIENPGIAPSPNIPADDVSRRVGFSDGLVDADGVMRRQLLGMAPPSKSKCATSTSLSLMLALRYLASENIAAAVLANGQLKIGEITLPTFYPNTGSYHNADDNGYQLMLNYRSLDSLDAIAPQLTLDQLLNAEYSPVEWAELISDRIVLVGSVATSFEDYHATPYSLKTPGVFIHAHQVSQLLSANLDGRPLLTSWPQLVEDMWILVWAMLGGTVMVMVKYNRPRALILLGIGGANYAVCYVLLLQALWVPLISPLLALMATCLMASLLLDAYDSKVVSRRA